jgi:hypothetical protein
MIVVRSVFQLKFGKAKEAKTSIKEAMQFIKEVGVRDTRAGLDATGRFYTLALENTYDSLGAFEEAMAKMSKDSRWQKWYAGFSQLVESGYREIFTLVE